MKAQDLSSSGAKAEKKPARRRITLTLLTVAGVLLMVFIVSRIGVSSIIASLRQVSLQQFLVLFLLRLAYWMLRTLCWQLIYCANCREFGFLTFFSARMAGHAVSQLTPTSQIGSEATRMMMVSSPGRKLSLSSIIIDKTIEMFTATGFTLLALIILVQRIQLPRMIQMVLLIPTAFFFILALVLILRQKKGLLTEIISLFSRLHVRPSFLEKNREKIAQTDQLISGFYNGHRRRFLLVVFLYSLLLALWITEVHLNMVFLNLPHVTLLESALVTLTGNITFLLAIIPGSLGVYEATYIGIFSLLGRPAEAAFSLVLMRRILALIMAGLGLLGFLVPRRSVVPAERPGNGRC